MLLWRRSLHGIRCQKATEDSISEIPANWQGKLSADQRFVSAQMMFRSHHPVIE
jgi:hypothetical protein